MKFRLPSPFTVIFTLVMLLLIGLGVYWLLNAFFFIGGTNGNSINVAASAAFGSAFLVLAIFILVARELARMNTHLNHISEAADEQVKLLRYIAKQSQPRQ
jgi:hypothetical protein